MVDLVTSVKILESGLSAQSSRIAIIAQNIANKDSIALVPGGEPYRRKRIYFRNVLDREIGVELVKVTKVDKDNSPFNIKLDHSHPAANEKGYVLYPNVNDIIENTDSQEAQLSYNANLSALSLTKSMIAKTLDILK